VARFRRILVTGASGFVGRHLTPRLASAFPDAQLYLDRFDVTDAAMVAHVVAAFAPDACVHLAAVAAIPAARQAPDRAWAVNLHGTLNLARAILRHAPDCFFLHVSSGDIYGRSFLSGKPLDETALLAPMNDYAATKAAADLAIGALVGEGLRAVRLRPFNHTGPGQSPDFVVAAFARQVARIKAGLQPPVVRVGNLEARRDFLDVRDVCGAYVACLRCADSLATGTILNVASGVPRRIGNILRDLLALAGAEAAIETDHRHLRPAEIFCATGDARQLRHLLEWKPEIAWQQTVSDVLDYWMAHVAADHTW
jgi:GDP-4-dehydro-6-deoxy-D-mannose reductase